ncbi:MAG: biosynthetic peptidoglycan transglycosylase, partial [Verrucomicrobiota bacterium]|nr:biosynthetic peptidoglycan transglycosylase [Verrucomicrobiota bacterium]
MLLTPLPEGILGPQREAVRFVDRRGEPLRFELADRRYHYQRFSLDDCPEHFIHATLAAEDKRYWSHGGIDLLATLRAAKDYLAKGRVVSGASTITQQLIKVAQPRSRTISAKLAECLQARKLERRWTKRQILEEYLNRLDYGNACRGASTACWFYFNKPLTDLSLAESA